MTKLNIINSVLYDCIKIKHALKIKLDVMFII